MLREGTLGVHPAGALGVAFFIHARAECFVGRGGEGITTALKRAGSFRLRVGDELRTIGVRGRVFANLLEAEALASLPEVVLVCCNPDQLPEFTAHVTRYVENLAGRGLLRSEADIERRVPVLLILPNGILAEQTLQRFEEQLRESMLLGRLEGFNEQLIEAVLGRVVRGVSLQAGGRKGEGPQAVYILERKGTLVFAGGSDAARQRVEAVLAAHDYPATHVPNVPPTRIEFDKAMISIVINVGGLIHFVRDDGSLIDLRMGDLCKDPSKAGFIDEVTRAVFEVGKAAGAYPPGTTYDEVWAKHRATILRNAGHVTSSLKSFRDALAEGLCSVELFPNEKWLLEPLARYAARVGNREAAALFWRLKKQVQEAFARAIRARQREAGASGASAMRLLAQRNFSIDLYESGADQTVLVGTMLDDEHLIKLELTIDLHDEQITRSRLQMIRAPFPVCQEVEAVADSLVGLRVERGVVAEIARRVGGRAGCSHIRELATSMVHFAATHLVRRRAGIDPVTTDYATQPPEVRFQRTRELLHDTCLAYCQTTPRGLDQAIGIRRVGAVHTHPTPLGPYEPSLGVVLHDRAEKWSDRVYLRYRDRDGSAASLTWRDFAAKTGRIARNLLALGIRPGDRVGMISENRVEMFLTELAVMSIGAVTVPIFAGYRPRQVAYVLGHARPRLLVVSGVHQLEKIERARHPHIERIWCMDFDGKARAWGAEDFAGLLAEGGADEAERRRRVEAVDPEDVCVIMYTSGTTGPPKGVQLCHRNLISQQKALQQIWDISPEDVFLSYLPWHHSFGGLFERFMTFYNGCQMCLDDSRGRDIDRLIENWKLFDPTIFFSVPRVHEELTTRCRHDRAAADVVFGGRLRMVFTAGAPLPEFVEAAYRDRGIPVLEGWGLTETSPCVTVTTRDMPWRSGYVGFPIPGVSVRVDADEEILVRGPNVMLGYLDDEEATAHVLDDDGWFHTGDLGQFTEDGLRIYGRKDGAFKLTTGEKVHPMRVESVLVNESPLIHCAIAVGSGKDYVGALIFPAIDALRRWAREHGIEDDGHLARHPAVRELFAREIARLNPRIEVKYQRVRRAVVLDREPSAERGELTPSLKIVRKAVLGNYRSTVESLFAPDPPEHVIIVPQSEAEVSHAATQ